MEEGDVGIRAFLSPEVPGFTGMFKYRYSDFIVREVALDGTVVRMLEPGRRGQAEPTIEANTEMVAARLDLERVLPAEELAALEALASQTEEKPRGDVPPILLHVAADKATRTAVHKAIRALFPALASETSADGQAICVTSKVSARRSLEPAGKRGRFAEQLWPGGSNRYVQFVLLKENRDTMDVIENMARSLVLKPSVFTYAGVKDRRAVTVQRITAYKVLPDRLAALEERSVLGDGVHLGDLRFVAQPLRCGELAGNRFTIVLRAIPSAQLAHVEAAARALGERGFVNFYGLQRFGNNPAAPTHHVGRAMLAGKLRAAIDLVLAPRSGERADVHAARTAYASSRDPAEGLRLMPNFMARERALLHGLQTDGANLHGTFARLPRSLRLLYLHGYQAYIWNCVASQRLSLFGRTAVAGDLVRAKEGEAGCAPRCADGKGDAHEGEQDEQAVGGEDEGGADLDAATVAVRALTQADIESGRFSVCDVLLPLPGSAVIYPANATAELYATTMAADGLDPADMMRHVRDHYSLGGAYRHLVLRPAELAHELLVYRHPDAILAVTDLDLVRARAEAGAPAASASGTTAVPVAAQASAPASEAAGEERHALRLDFTLPAGAYATMALRELCKQSTEITKQIALSTLQGGGTAQTAQQPGGAPAEAEPTA